MDSIRAPARMRGEIDRGGAMASQVGKRYQCSQCNTEMIVTKAGERTLQCCGKEMQQK